MKEAKYLTVREAALKLGVTQKYVRDLLYENRLAGAQKRRRTWRIPIGTIDARLAATRAV